VIEIARAVEFDEEIRIMRHSIDVCARSITRMRDVLEPGVRESEMLATLMNENLRLGGEYPDTRLLTSGPRTNPWLQGTSDRILEPGDLVAFDTDLIGPLGFFTDVSRTWLVVVACVESYIGAVDGREGVELEQPVVVTRDGSQPLCSHPFEDHFHWVGRSEDRVVCSGTRARLRARKQTDVAGG
jgi:Xaa-Pro aminopeptidase